MRAEQGGVRHLKVRSTWVRSLRRIRWAWPASREASTLLHPVILSDSEESKLAANQVAAKQQAGGCRSV